MRDNQAERRISELTAARRSNFLDMKRQIAERQLVDRREAAKLLAVTLRTLRRWHDENQGPPRISFGVRKVFYAMPDILEHLNARERRRNKRLGKAASSPATVLTSPRE